MGIKIDGKDKAAGDIAIRIAFLSYTLAMYLLGTGRGPDWLATAAIWVWIVAAASAAAAYAIGLLSAYLTR